VSKYIRLSVSVLLVAFIVWRTNWSEVADRFANLRVEMWFCAIGLALLAQIASARRWQLFARALQFEHSLPRYCTYNLIGMYFSLLLPTSVGGDVMRVWYLNGNAGRKWAALASVFLERISGLLMLILMACVGIVMAPVELPWWIVASVWGIAGTACLGLASVPLLKRWHKLPSERRQQLQMLLDLMRSPGMLAESTLMSILVQGAGVLSLWALGQGLDLDVPLSYYCVLGTLVSLLMLLPVSLNGMGVREGGTVLLLAPLGIDAPTALALAFLWFTIGIAISLLGGIVYLFGTFPQVAPAPEVTPQATC
jgi:uncharacterized membrane protein YbhN (UPF0104 family)